MLPAPPITSTREPSSADSNALDLTATSRAKSECSRLVARWASSSDTICCDRVAEIEQLRHLRMQVAWRHYFFAVVGERSAPPLTVGQRACERLRQFIRLIERHENAILFF